MNKDHWNSNALKLVKAARKHNKELDKLDHKVGFASPDQGPIDVCLRTVLEALRAGLNLEDWQIVAEAYCILDEVAEAEREHAECKP